jgi:hypothetical protein
MPSLITVSLVFDSCRSFKSQRERKITERKMKENGKSHLAMPLTSQIEIDLKAMKEPMIV